MPTKPTWNPPAVSPFMAHVFLCNSVYRKIFSLHLYQNLPRKLWMLSSDQSHPRLVSQYSGLSRSFYSLKAGYVSCAHKIPLGGSGHTRHPRARCQRTSPVWKLSKKTSYHNTNARNPLFRGSLNSTTPSESSSF